ncbi:MAG: thioredoxin-dependent thiol peroxidase [Deltaproteobacteria bacterium]|nr:thioredoxin-dependent thiol peroxidase [Deltaproteobacteria bacterium]
MATKTTKTSPAKKTAGALRAGAKRSKAKAVTKGALAAGDKAPGFALADQGGAVHKLSDHAGRKVLVYFYPKADTPGCTVQACSVRDARPTLGKRGVDVIGISPDKPPAQLRFDIKHRLGFPLLADADHAVARAFGVWREKSMYGRKYLGIVRSAFLIDEQGRIEAAWYGVSPKDTVPGALAALAG